jgi:hypothetical protein
MCHEGAMLPSRSTPQILVPFFAFVALVASALMGGCDQAPPLALSSQAAQLPQAVGEPCPTTPGSANFAAEIDGFRLEVSGIEGQAPVSVEGAVGETITAEGVPEGPEQVVTLHGTKGGATVWRGVRTGVEVVAGQNTEVDVLMTKPGQISCPRSPQTTPRAFHTATVLPDGRVIIVGGIQEVADTNICGGCIKLTARAEVELYDPGKGSFHAVGSLAQGRLFHTATALPDGRVLVAGGTAEAIIDPNQPFPIRPTGPWESVEVIDPDSGTISQVGSDPAGSRVFHTATLLPDGNVLLAGGVPGQIQAGNDLSNALSSTTICASTNLACVQGPTMKRPRAGHVAFLLESGQLILWGGSVNFENVDGIQGWQLETLVQPTDTAFTMLATQAMAYTRNVFFPAFSRYRDFRVVIAGGYVRLGDGTFTTAVTDGSGGSNQGAVFVFDARAGVAGGISTGTTDPDVTPPMGLATPVLFGSAAALPGGSRVVVGGGFSDLATLTPTDALSLYDEGTLSVRPLVTLNQRRGGVVASAVGNGTVLFTGGMDETRALLTTGEIFTDPSEVTP